MDDLERDTGRLLVRGKGNKEREVWLTDEALQAVDDWIQVRRKEPGALLLPVEKDRRTVRHREADGSPARLSESTIRLACRRRAAQAGLSAFSPHDLRRTSISDILDLTGDLALVSELAGHANPATNKRYHRRPAENRRRAARSLHAPYQRRTNPVSAAGQQAAPGIDESGGPPGFFPRNPDHPDPEPNLDTPPDSADPTGICPRCGRNSNFKGVSAPIPLTFTGLQITNRDGSSELDPAERVNAMFCMGCGRASAVVEEKWVGQQPWREGGRSGTIRWRGIHWWPPLAVAGITNAVPQAIRSCFEEGLRCLGAGAPRGAAVMFGHTLEAIFRDKGSQVAVTAMEKNNLATGLKVMADEHAITPDLAEWAKEIRLARNVGGHFDPIDDVDVAAEISAGCCGASLSTCTRWARRSSGPRARVVAPVARRLRSRWIASGPHYFAAGDAFGSPGP